MKRVMITCKDAHRLMSEQLDHALPLGTRLRLKLHLSICDACSRVARQFTLIRNSVRRLGE